MNNVVCCGTCINFNIKEEDHSFDKKCELLNFCCYTQIYAI